MSNSWFQFKQFTIHQDRCAMKVSTDACIQGAWTPVKQGVQRILDIGCGTGLLTLMLAQRTESAIIDAIELDEDAALQAKENVQKSPWQDRINVIQADVRDYTFTEQYDMVICNPPFFNNSLLGDDTGRNQVRHTLSLSYKDLFEVIKKVLTPGGYASILLPAAEHVLWKEIVTNGGWGFESTLKVYPKHNASYNRVVSISTANSDGMQQEQQLQIYAANGGYTTDFVELMRPFYLKL
ncbi:MAG: methyltransferase [Bacteroidetes bacterium]|nr:methyltransferase [Bacteroidota bacterium]